MTPALRRFIFPTDSDTEAIYAYLRLLGVRVTRSAAMQALGEHPDSGSLLAVSEVLDGFGVGNVAARVTADRLEQIETPFLVRIRSGDGLSLAVVKEFYGDSATYWLPARQHWVTSDKETLLEDFNGIILMGEATEAAGQPDYAGALAAEKRKHAKTVAGLLVLPALVAAIVTSSLFRYGMPAVVPALYMLFALVGTAVGALLLWYEVDRHNPALRQVCSGGKKINCDAILQSNASGIFGISWSLIGFSYFAGSLLALMLDFGIGWYYSVFQLISYFGVAALGYVGFSLYYQWRVVRQWCRLCLWIQGILVAQAVLVLVDGRLFTSAPRFSISVGLTLVGCFAVPFLVGLVVVPAAKKAKEGDKSKLELTRLKRNPQIFHALLEKQKAVTEPVEGLGITLGPPNAKHRLIKVCNPYCGPCARAHPDIEEILNNNVDVQVRIIFTASDDNNDYKAPPAKHLMALAEKEDEPLLKQALEDWYNAPEKDYGVFSRKYPMNGELERQGEKLVSMKKWCEAMEVRFTPTFYVDGYQLPEVYTVKDLKYFLNK